jgi:hypothetical protein
MDMKIYMATQANKTVLIRLNLTEKRAVMDTYDHEGVETRVSALEALISELNKFNLEENNLPLQLFVNDHMYKNIVNGYYKYWLLTGKTQEGEKIDASELKLWEIFNDIYTMHNIKIIIKSTSEAKIPDRVKEMEGKYATRGRNKGKKIEISPVSKQNDKYASRVWDELKKHVGSANDIIEENFDMAQ